jgi:hypothetical protein
VPSVDGQELVRRADSRYRLVKRRHHTVPACTLHLSRITFRTHPARDAFTPVAIVSSCP